MIGTRRGCFGPVLVWDLDEKGLAPIFRTPLAGREGVGARRAAKIAPLPAAVRNDARPTVGAKHDFVTRSIKVDMVKLECL